MLAGPQLVSEPPAAAPEPPAAALEPPAAVPAAAIVMPAVAAGDAPAVPVLPAAALPAVLAGGVIAALPEFAATPDPSVLLLQPFTAAVNSKEAAMLVRYDRSKCRFMKTTFAFGRLPNNAGAFSIHPADPHPQSRTVIAAAFTRDQESKHGIEGAS